MLLVPLGAGGALTLEEVAVVALRHAGVAGPLLAVFSVGGVLGGLAYGRRVWRMAPGRRLFALAALCGGCYAVPLAVAALPGLAVAFLVAGAAEDSALITCYLLVDVLVPPDGRAEAGAWVNTAYNLGTAAGSGAAGVLVDDRGPRSALLAAGLLSCGVAALAAAWGAPLRARGERVPVTRPVG